MIYTIDRYGIEIEVFSDGSGRLLKSKLHDVDADDDLGNFEYDYAVSAIESFLLALACEGIDITQPAIQRALDTAIDDCCNHLS